MKIEKKYMDLAMELHRNYPVVDAHLDLAGELLFRKKMGEKNPLKIHYLENLRICGCNLVVSSIYIRNEELPEMGLREALDQISALLEAIDLNPEFLLVRTAQDLNRVIREDRIGILLYMEGLDCIGRDIRLLRILWELGVRGASLTWSRRNALASGCCKASEQINISGGLSADGYLAVEEMERMGMFLDVSHLNDEGFADICKSAGAAFAATHSNSRSVHFHYRNMTDEQIKELAARGGVMGLNGCDCIVGSSCGPVSLEMLCRHVEHVVSLVGINYVGYGFDFCDSYMEAEPRLPLAWNRSDCLGDHSHVPELTAALLKRGMREEDAVKVIGGNWVRYFRKLLPG